MARRRRYEYIVDPILKATVVHKSFVHKVKDPRARAEMREHYEKKLSEYSEREDKQLNAILKLAGYYIGLSDPEVRKAIREAIGKAVDRKTEIYAKLIEEGKVPTPVVTKEVKETAEEVSKLVSDILREVAAPEV